MMTMNDTITYTPTKRICAYIGTGTGCDDHAITGRSYCEAHYFTVYQTGTARAKRKKDIRTANRVWDLQNALNEAIAELEAEGYDVYADHTVID